MNEISVFFALKSQFMKYLYPLICALLITSAVHAQSIHGKISYMDKGYMHGEVMLYGDNGSNTMMPIMLTTQPDTAGMFSFTDLENGDYMLRFIPDSSKFMPTYNGDVHRWDQVSAITVADDSTFHEIHLLTTYTWWSGPGSCGGTGRYYTIGKTTGDPIPGVDVSLEQVPGGEARIMGTTDEDGFYKIDEMPMNTVYDVHIEVPGLPYDSTYRIELTNANPDMLDLDFSVDTTPGAGKILIHNYVNRTVELGNPQNWTQLFPNPAHETLQISAGFTPQSGDQIVIVDLNGKQVAFQTQVNQTNYFDVVHWPSGLYSYHWLNENGQARSYGTFNIVH